MAMNNNHTVWPISGNDQSQIITTLNHNFQVLTERIKELNISLSYLDILKIATIFNATMPALVAEPAPLDPPEKAESESQEEYEARVDAHNQAVANYEAYLAQIPSAQNSNLQRFVSSCWNTLANYAGVYIQCTADKSNPLFMWMGQEVKHGGFIVKLPNNQSLYLPGADPTYLVPDSYDTDTNTITYVTASAATSASITLNFASAASTTLVAGTSSLAASTTVPSTYCDCRFYINNEEIFFADYYPGATTFKVPVAVNAYYIDHYTEPTHNTDTENEND